jgi:hypothetical protein
VEICVRDHGEGIPPEILAHVFDRFYRGEDQLTIPGFGLGLSIAKALVEGAGRYDYDQEPTQRGERGNGCFSSLSKSLKSSNHSQARDVILCWMCASLKMYPQTDRLVMPFPTVVGKS